MTVHPASLPFACAGPASGAVAVPALSPSLPSSFPDVPEGLLGGALSVLSTANTRARKRRDLQCAAPEERHTYVGGASVQGKLGWRELRETGLGWGLARMGRPRVTSRLVWGTAAPLYRPQGAKLGCELVAGHLGRTRTKGKAQKKVSRPV